jgi:hypothetical protein
MSDKREYNLTNPIEALEYLSDLAASAHVSGTISEVMQQAQWLKIAHDTLLNKVSEPTVSEQLESKITDLRAEDGQIN